MLACGIRKEKRQSDTIFGEEIKNHFSQGYLVVRTFVYSIQFY